MKKNTENICTKKKVFPHAISIHSDNWESWLGFSGRTFPFFGNTQQTNSRLKFPGIIESETTIYGFFRSKLLIMAITRI